MSTEKDGYHTTDRCPVVGYGRGFCHKCTDAPPPVDIPPSTRDSTAKTGDTSPESDQGGGHTRTRRRG